MRWAIKLFVSIVTFILCFLNLVALEHFLNKSLSLRLFETWTSFECRFLIRFEQIFPLFNWSVSRNWLSGSNRSVLLSFIRLTITVSLKRWILPIKPLPISKSQTNIFLHWIVLFVHGIAKTRFDQLSSLNSWSSQIIVRAHFWTYFASIVTRIL